MDKNNQYRYCENCEYFEGINNEAMDAIVCRLAGVPQLIVQHASNCVGFEPRRRKMDKDKKPCFYDKIYIHPDHLDAWRKEYNSNEKAMDSLIEEMAELTKAICKVKRSFSPYSPFDAQQGQAARENMREEVAHVLISLAGLAFYYDCTLNPENVQKEIQSKWPEAYKSKGCCCGNCYWSYFVGGLDAKLLCSATHDSEVELDHSCRGFIPKVDSNE